MAIPPATDSESANFCASFSCSGSVTIQAWEWANSSFFFGEAEALDSGVSDGEGLGLAFFLGDADFSGLGLGFGVGDFVGLAFFFLRGAGVGLAKIFLTVVLNDSAGARCARFPRIARQANDAIKILADRMAPTVAQANANWSRHATVPV